MPAVTSMTHAPRWSRSIAQAYGLRLQRDDGADAPAPGGDRGDETTLRIKLDATPAWADHGAPSLRYRHPHRDHSGVPLLHWHDFGGGRHSLEYADECRFFLDVAARTLWARWPAALTDEDVATYLLGPVLSFFLRLSGKVSLHASVVMIGGSCVAFAGPAGSGKSTLAAAFAALGHPVLTEDVACLDETAQGFSVRPGYPLIRLWQNSESLLPRDGGTLPLLTPNWDKRYLALDSERHRFHGEPAPLAAIYLLQPRETLAVPAVASTVTGQHALSLLIANTHANYLLDRDMQAREFEVLGRLGRTVPVRSLTLTADGSRLMQAAEWIRQHAAT